MGLRSVLLVLLLAAAGIALWALSIGDVDAAPEIVTAGALQPEPEPELDQRRESLPALLSDRAAVSTAPREDVPAQSTPETGEDGWLLLPSELLIPPGGLQSRVVGRVFDSEGNPLGGTNLQLRLLSGDVALTLGQTHSRADGRYWIDLPTSGPAAILDWEREQRRRERELHDGKPARQDDPVQNALIHLRLVASHHGYLSRALPVARASGRGVDRRRDVILERGQEVLGRILGREGEGISGAEVRLVSTQDLAIAAQTITSWNGTWSARMPSPGFYHLHARMDGVGAAVMTDLELPTMLDGPLPDLTLVGDAVLAGRVEYPDKKSARGVRVEAVPYELHGAGIRRVPPDRLLLEEQEGGLWGGSAISSRAGNFRIAGLVSGVYALTFPEHPDLEGSGPVETSAHGLIVSFPLPRLVIQLYSQGADSWAALRLERRIDWSEGGQSLSSTLESSLPHGVPTQ
jgi:hypothetical protein